MDIGGSFPALEPNLHLVHWLKWQKCEANYPSSSGSYVKKPWNVSPLSVLAFMCVDAYAQVR
jgi:hypothetical protein